jgi:hypothetical protein
MNAWDMIQGDSPDFQENLRKAKEIGAWISAQIFEERAALVLDFLEILSDVSYSIELRTRVALRLVTSAVQLKIPGSQRVAKKIFEILETQFGPPHLRLLSEMYAEFFGMNSEITFFQALFSLLMISDFRRATSITTRWASVLEGTALGDRIKNMIGKVNPGDPPG